MELRSINIKIQIITFNFVDVINQKDESKYISNNFSSSGKVIRNDIQVKVEGEHCHTELNGIFLLPITNLLTIIP